MLPRTLKFKVGFYLAISMMAAMLVFTLLIVMYQREERFDDVAEHVTQLSEMIAKSTRYAMLQNQPAYVDRIIHDVANQGGIDRVRILSKEGRIMHSTYPPELGQTVDRKAEACFHCHQSEKTPEKKYIDINKLILETAHLIERPAHLRDIVIAMDLDLDLPQVWADADQITQVIMNMLVNAQHAIEDKGSITVRSRPVQKAPGSDPAGQPVPMVEVAIIDTGCGIPNKNLKRIFDPFFTSKEVGKGTGLGLSVSHGIVSAHGGIIEVESEVGQGSTFRIYLPMERPPGAAPGGENGSHA